MKTVWKAAVEAVMNLLFPRRAVCMGCGSMLGCDRDDLCETCRETLAALALAAVNGPEFIWRPAFGDTPGAPVLFPRWTFPELFTLPEGKGGGVVVKKYPEHLRTVGVRDEYELMDADSPQDLSFLAER